MASIASEGVGFEPTRVRKDPTGFRDRRLRPLGHPSMILIEIKNTHFYRSNL